VLLFAAVSYVAALRAARGRQMRTGLLPGAVDRHIARQRDQAAQRVRRRFNRPARASGSGQLPGAAPSAPPSAPPSAASGAAPEGPPVDPEAPTAP
jgi:hypothetical protein